MYVQKPNKKSLGDIEWVSHYQHHVKNVVYLDIHANRYIEFFNKVVDMVDCFGQIGEYGVGSGINTKILQYLLPKNSFLCYDTSHKCLNLANENLSGIIRKNQHKIRFRNEDVFGSTRSEFFIMIYSLGLYNYYPAEDIRKNITKQQRISNHFCHAVHGIKPEVWVPKFCNRKKPEYWRAITSGLDVKVTEVNDTYYLLTWSK